MEAPLQMILTLLVLIHTVAVMMAAPVPDVPVGQQNYARGGGHGAGEIGMYELGLRKAITGILSSLILGSKH